MTTQTIRNGKIIRLNILPGESVAVVAVSGTYNASIVQGAGLGAIATNATGATYGPYSSGIVIQLTASEASEIDFDVGVSPVIASDSVASYTYDANGNVTGFGGPGGTLPISTHPLSCVLFGDSMTAQNEASSASLISYADKGYFNWANAYLGQRLRLLDVAGVSGDTTALMLARIDADVIASSPGWCFVLGGFNDVNNGVAVATTISNLQSIYRKLIAAGIKIAAISILPSSTFTTATKKEAVAYINLWMREYCLRNQGMVYVDAYTPLLDPTSANGAHVTAYLTDTIHPSTSGAQRIGLAIYNALNQILPPSAMPFSIAEPASATHPYGNLVINPVMQGSGGTNQSGSSGTLAASWYSIIASGTATAVCSKVARSDYPGLTWQQVDITSTSGASTYDLYAYSQSLASSGLAVGTQVYGEFEVELSFTGVTVSEFKGYIFNSTGTGIVYSYGLGNNNGGIIGGSFRIRTPDFTIPLDATSLPRAYVEIVFSGSGSLILKVGRTEMRRVLP